MSVKTHEAYSLDSQQDRLLWFDDFLGDQLQDEWASTITGGGAVAVIDAQTGGIVRLTTGALNGNDTTINWGNIRSLHVDQKVTFETRVKIATVTAINSQIGLVFDANNSIIFIESGGDWLIRTRDGGASTQPNSGVSLDTDYHIYRIEAFPTGEVHFYIDDAEVTNSPNITNIPDDAADFLQPILFIETTEDVAKTMDIDYVVVRQEI